MEGDTDAGDRPGTPESDREFAAWWDNGPAKSRTAGTLEQKLGAMAGWHAAVAWARSLPPPPPSDDLPELTDEERMALGSLPHDFITRLLGGERLEFGSDGKAIRWVKQAPPADAEAVRLAERLVLVVESVWGRRFYGNERDAVRQKINTVLGRPRNEGI